MNRINHPFLMFFMLVFLTAPPILATRVETHTGSIRVKVVDPNGQIVVGATVSCEQSSTGRTKTCTTDKDGICVFGGLEVGSYTIKVEAGGFKNSVHSPVAVNAAKPTPLESQLQIGSAEETVTVSGETAQLETESTERVTTLSENQISNLPLRGRNFLELALLMPGTTVDSASRSANGAASFSANGSRTSSNNISLDGQDVTDSFRNVAEPSVSSESPAHLPTLPTEGLAEFQIQTSFDVQDGRHSGAVIDLTIKSGTNEVHGSAFDFFRNDALNARDFFNANGPKDELNYNDFGFSLGGPFKKDKAFWFGAYEGRRENRENPTLLKVPSSFDFMSALLDLHGDPSIPPEQNPVVNPVIRRLFALCRSSARCPGGEELWPQPTPSRSSLVLNSVAKTMDRIRSHSGVIKTQFVLNDRNELSAYYSVSNSSRSFPLPLAGGEAMPSTNTRHDTRDHVVSVAHRLIFPTKINELRIGWNRYHRKFLDQDSLGIGNPTETIGLNTGVTNSRDFGLPHLVVRDFSFLGASPFANPKSWNGTNWRVAERFDLVSGEHSWTLGYDFKHDTVTSFNDVNFRSKLVFSSLSDFLAGGVASGAILKGISDRTTNQSSHAVYAHDQFRRSPNLTLDYGVRWEYLTPLEEPQMLFSRYDPTTGLSRAKRLYKRDLNNFSSRVGFVWKLTGSGETILRVGGGSYFDAFPQDFFVGQLKFNTFNAGVAYNPIPERPVLTSRSPTPIIQPLQPVFPEATFASDSRDVSTTAEISTPYSISYSLNIQQQLFWKMVLEVAYVGSQGRKLFRTRDINAPPIPGGARPFDNSAVLSSVAPNQPFVVNQFETSAKSNYNSLQTSLKRSLSQGLTYYSHWTWSHSIDDASDGIDSVPNRASPDNHHAPERERADSSFDTRHSVVWGFTYDIPESIRRIRLGKGWQIGGILRLSSGQPYHVNFADEFDSKGFYDFILRPDVVGDPLFRTSSPDRLLNLAAVRVPCTLDGGGADVSHCIPGTLHFGNLPRNAFIGPNFRNLDFQISRTITLKENVKLQLKSEFFNLTNHPNFSSPLVPQFIARASQKGIDTNGRGGAGGTACNTAAASDDCYLSATRTSNGARSIQVSIRLTF